jgi:hypothetical protein
MKRKMFSSGPESFRDFDDLTMVPLPETCVEERVPAIVSFGRSIGCDERRRMLSQLSNF